MLDSLTYPTRFVPVNYSTVTGQYLSRARWTRRERDFIGRDLYRGVKQLVEPTLAQAAFLAGSNVSAVWWACQRENYRDEITSGLLPLVPPHPKKKPPLLIPSVYDDAEIIAFVRSVGIPRVLDAAVAVEAAE
jgi:hypothetical protein